MKHRAPFDGWSWTCEGVFSVICFAVLSPTLPRTQSPPICLTGALSFGTQYSKDFSTEAHHFLILFPDWSVANRPKGQEEVRRLKIGGCVNRG